MNTLATVCFELLRCSSRTFEFGHYCCFDVMFSVMSSREVFRSVFFRADSSNFTMKRKRIILSALREISLHCSALSQIPCILSKPTQYPPRSTHMEKILIFSTNFAYHLERTHNFRLLPSHLILLYLSLTLHTNHYIFPSSLLAMISQTTLKLLQNGFTSGTHTDSHGRYSGEE